MNDRGLSEVIQYVRRAALPEQAAGLGDAELLRRWVANRDEAAFEVVLWRHAPMVLGVCRRVLHDGHAAEDALQATFLALARKAGAIGKRDAVAGWLYRVAYRVALASKAKPPRWQVQDADGLASARSPTVEDPVWKDLRPVLDEEVSRLSEKYRVPFVLHYLEGRTNEEVACELGCPLGTVLSRLGRARERLRFRLTRRGVTLSVAALAVLLSSKALSAAVPAAIIGPLVKAAAQVAAGQAPVAGLVSANAAALAAAVLKEMTMTKLIVVLVAVLALGLAGVGTGTLAHRLNAGQPAVEPAVQDKAGAVRQPDPEAEALRKAEASRRDAEREEAVAKERERLRAEEARKVALEFERKVLADAEDRYLAVQMKWKNVKDRDALVRAEESLRSLERQQATEREREQEEWKSLHAQAVKGGEPLRVRLKDFEGLTKKLEEERTERLIDLRVKMAREEDRLRETDQEMGFQYDMAREARRAAAERVRQLEENRSPADAQSQSLREIERKLADVLRELGEMRRAADRPAAGKVRPAAR